MFPGHLSSLNWMREWPGHEACSKSHSQATLIKGTDLGMRPIDSSEHKTSELVN